LLVNGEPLVFYHFQGFRQWDEWFIDPGLDLYGAKCPLLLVKKVHKVYVQAVFESTKVLAGVMNSGSCGSGNTRHGAPAEYRSLSLTYKLRCFLEGKVMLRLLRVPRFVDNPLLRSLIRGYSCVR
jgi:hypothetical protein